MVPLYCDRVDSTVCLVSRAEYCAELVYEDTGVVINDERPTDYYIKIVPTVIKFDRSLSSIRESLANQQFALHPHNLGEDFIGQLNSLSIDPTQQ